MLKRQAFFCGAFLATALLLAPVAWAVGWVNVGPAEIHLNQQLGLDVATSNAVYSSQMRIYVHTHSPCGGPNFWNYYLYATGGVYAVSQYREICTAAETPSYWGVAGGNKIAACAERYKEPTDPASTCQRYSTT
jgi:hypothetical protein